MGAKYVIEIEELVQLDRGNYNFVKGFNTLVLDDYALGKLIPLEEYADEAYRQGFEAGKNIRGAKLHMLYAKGVEDLHTYYADLYGMSQADITDALDVEVTTFSDILSYDPCALVEKMKAYSEKKKKKKKKKTITNRDKFREVFSNIPFDAVSHNSNGNLSIIDTSGSWWDEEYKESGK